MLKIGGAGSMDWGDNEFLLTVRESQVKRTFSVPTLFTWVDLL
jgi:hypothetical protein